jgi:FkbM family methyltransferase
MAPVRTILGRARERATASATNRFAEYRQALPKRVSEPVFVKVGANDGVTGDPCADLLLASTPWKGLLIEPVPDCFERLKANVQRLGRFVLEQVAIGTPAGEAIFYYVSPEAIERLPGLPPWFDQLGSFDRNHIVKHLEGVLEPFIIECSVQVRPLSEVLARNRIQEVHLLHVDAEGHDFEVLKTLDFSRHAPLSIFVEHKHLDDVRKSGMFQLLSKHGYSVLDCGGDYFAVNREADKKLNGGPTRI